MNIKEYLEENGFCDSEFLTECYNCDNRIETHELINDIIDIYEHHGKLAVLEYLSNADVECPTCYCYNEVPEEYLNNLIELVKKKN